MKRIKLFEEFNQDDIVWDEEWEEERSEPIFLRNDNNVEIDKIKKYIRKNIGNDNKVDKTKNNYYFWENRKNKSISIIVIPPDSSLNKDGFHYLLALHIIDARWVETLREILLKRLYKGNKINNIKIQFETQEDVEEFLEDCGLEIELDYNKYSHELLI
jgi:hypothetical protein